MYRFFPPKSSQKEVPLANLKPRQKKKNQNYNHYTKVGQETLKTLEKIRQDINNKKQSYNTINSHLVGIERQIITTRRAFAIEVSSLDSNHKYAKHAKENRNHRIFTSNKNWPGIMGMTEILKNISSSRRGALK